MAGCASSNPRGERLRLLPHVQGLYQMGQSAASVTEVESFWSKSWRIFTTPRGCASVNSPCTANGGCGWARPVRQPAGCRFRDVLNHSGGRMQLHRFFTFALPFLAAQPIARPDAGRRQRPQGQSRRLSADRAQQHGGIQTRNTDNVAHPRGWNYTWSTTPRAWVPAKEAPGNKTYGLSTRGAGGPGMPFIKQMADAYPDYHIGVISNASYSCTCKGRIPGTTLGYSGRREPLLERREAVQ